MNRSPYCDNLMIRCTCDVIFLSCNYTNQINITEFNNTMYFFFMFAISHDGLYLSIPSVAPTSEHVLFLQGI